MPLWLAALLGYLIVARVTRFLNSDYLAGGIRARVVMKYGDGKLYYLVTCPWCASIWIGLPVALYVALVSLDGVFGTLFLIAGLWCGYSYVHGLVDSNLDES